MTLSPDDLIAISLQANALQYIWEFNRNRARTYIISEGLYQVEQMLSQLGANR